MTQRATPPSTPRSRRTRPPRRWEAMEEARTQVSAEERLMRATELAVAQAAAAHPRCANHKVTAYVSADGMAPAVAPFRTQTTSPPPSLRPSRVHGRRSARPSRAVLARAREQPERAHGEWQNPDREEPSRGETPPGLRAHAFRTGGPPAHAFRPRAVMARYFHTSVPPRASPKLSRIDRGCAGAIPEKTRVHRRERPQ